jgi:hypothetical protein
MESEQEVPTLVIDGETWRLVATEDYPSRRDGQRFLVLIDWTERTLFYYAHMHAERAADSLARAVEQVRRKLAELSASCVTSPAAGRRRRRAFRWFRPKSNAADRALPTLHCRQARRVRRARHRRPRN